MRGKREESQSVEAIQLDEKISQTFSNQPNSSLHTSFASSKQAIREPLSQKRNDNSRAHKHPSRLQHILLPLLFIHTNHTLSHFLRTLLHETPDPTQPRQVLLLLLNINVIRNENRQIGVDASFVQVLLH